MREYLVSGVPLRDPREKYFIDYTASTLFSENSRAITSGSLFGTHGDVQEKENYFGSSKETLVLNVLGDDKEEHNVLLRGLQGLFARKDFTVLSAPQRTPLVTNLIPDPEPDSITDWNANGLALVTAPWDAAKTAARTTSTGAFVHHIFSVRNTTRLLKAGETIKVTAKVAASNPAQQFYISPHNRAGGTYPTSPLASAAPFTAGAGWQTVSFTSVLTADIPQGQADVALVGIGVPPASETMTMGDVTLERVNASARDGREFNVATSFLRTGLFRAVGSAAIERINERTARITWILENIWGLYRSVSEYTTTQVLMTSTTMPLDFSTLAADSNAPINAGLMRFKGPLSIGGTIRVTGDVSGKMIGIKPTVALLSTEYVVVDIATLKANKVTTDSWATTGGVDWSARVEVGGEGSFSFEPGAPANGFMESGIGFTYSATIVTVTGTSATGVEFRFNRSYLS